ncbi:VCBS domain-containing protein [Vibrio europaeus]|uniref:VCBS domain-containing protein n=1 Tax=Vibrio europaeus TaxID=300876 RepID=UPI0023422D5F|nr:VCBS domain-containing protein [Vibrio europaeus]MDC5839044.1 VCBS domain-containing protein [Vibrio europaeus]
MKQSLSLPEGAQIAVDKDGNVRVLPLGLPPRPEEIVITQSDLDSLPELRDALIDSSEQPLAFDSDIDDVARLLEQGLDPTALSEFSPAAGGTNGASLTLSQSIERDGVEKLAKTEFETRGLDKEQGEKQRVSLFDDPAYQATNQSPQVFNEQRTFTEESGFNLVSPLIPFDVNGEVLSIMVTELPTKGFMSHFDGTPITIGETLTIEQLENICFHAPEECQEGDVAGLFSYSVDDGVGAFNSVQQASVQILLQPLNDAPVAFDSVETVVENQRLEGRLPQGEDVDGTIASYQLVANPELGGVTVNSDGSFVFETETDFDFLPEGETTQVSFLYSVTDDGGLDSELQTVTITVTGINDAAVIAGVDFGQVVEDSQGVKLTDSGQLTVTDVDGQQEEAFDTNSVVPAAGVLGQLEIDETGLWQYSVDNADVQYLGEGETKQEIFTVSSVDGTEHTVAVTIIGVNDAAVISGQDTGSVKEDESTPLLTESGTLTISDVDGADEELFVPASLTAPEDAFGALTIDENGQWNFELESSSIQYLGEGETITQVYTVESIDGTSHPITIQIIGTNDAAVITGDDVGTVTEDESTPQLIDTGSLRISDVDGEDEELFVAATGISSAGALGSLDITQDGDWTYTVDNADVQYLSEGETKVETFTVESLDGTEHTVAVTIIGVNDSAEISGDDIGAVAEDDDTPLLTDSGTLTISDADDGEAEFKPSSVVASEGALGLLTIDATGNWDYQVDNADVQYLGEGEAKVETFTVESLDGTQHTITVTITGVNDSAVIAGVDTGEVTEDESTPLLTDSGSLTISDADDGEAEFKPTSVVASAGALGSLTIDEAGNWDYVVANDSVQYLGDGETKIETFTVESLDDTQHTITVTITGINDTAVIAGVDTGEVTEDDSNPLLTDSGTLTITDADDGEAEFKPSSVVASSGALGSLTIDAAGNWDYQVDNADVQYLGEGETKVETFTVESLDGTQHTITVTIIGVNDSAEIAGDDVGAVTEDDDTPLLTDSGTLTISDADSGEAELKPNSVVASAGALGSLTIDAAGNWDYQVDNADVQYLGEGETKVETFTVESLDGTQHTITVTITGVNDAAVISGDDVGTVTEDESTPQLTDTGSLRISDIDGEDEELFVAATGITSAGALGSLDITQDGDWTYTVDNADAQYLAEGETKVETFTVESLDGTEHTVTVTIVGTNDIPSMLGDLSGEVKEEATLQTTGTLTPVDVDNGATHTWALVGETDSTYGSISIDDQTGEWTYTLDNYAAQPLAEGQEVQETFVVEVDDGLGGTSQQNIVITIEGTNDDPVISGDDSGNTVEDLMLVADGVLSVADIDVTDTHTWSIKGNGQGSYGSITINQNGEWEYALDPSLTQSFEHGEIYQEQTFTAIVNDGNGGTDSFEIDIDILGQNDAPSISGRSTRTIWEDDGSGARSGTLNTGDPDVNEVHTWSIVGDPDGQFGSLTLEQNGVWTYTLDTNATQAANTQALSLNQSVKEYFMVQVVDKHNQVDTQQVVVTVKGRNDASEIDGVLVGTVTEDDALPVTTSGQLNHNDVDGLDDHVWSLQTNQGQYGSLLIDANGEWTYILTNGHSAVQALLPGETLTETFLVTVTDDTNDNKSSNNASDTETITITIEGSNDTPSITGGTTGSVIEDTPAKSSAIGKLLALDIDTNDAHSWKVVGEDINGEASGLYGILTVDDNGQWVYQLDSTRWSTQSIPPGTTEVDTFQVEVTDINGATETITVDISVAGVNTTPDIVLGDTPTIVEDDAPNTISGTFGSGDPDVGDSALWSVISNGSYGNFVLDTNGGWVYTLDNGNNAVNRLDEGDLLQDSVQIKVVDRFGEVSIKDFTIEIEGNNDGPSIKGDVAKTIREDTASFSGQLQDGDPDADDTHLWSPSNLVGSYGSFTMTSSGAWVYSLNNVLEEIQELNPNQTLQENFTVEVVDSYGETDSRDVVITIRGTNDLPTVSGDIAGTFVEDQAAPDITGVMTLSDIDDADTPSFIANSYQGNFGQFDINQAGEWSFTAYPDSLDAMKREEVVSEVFTVIAEDDFGGVITQYVTINIEGTNDVPVITGDSSGSVIEDGANFGGIDFSSTSGQLTSSDVDKDSSVVSWAIENGTDPDDADYGQGIYGTLTLGNNGQWVYQLNNSDPDTQALNLGDVGQETFYVSATDNDGGVSEWHQITIDVYGQDENGFGGGTGPGTNLGTINAVVIEDTQPTVSGTIAPAYTISQVSPLSGGVFGELDFTSPSDWDYQLFNNSALVQGLSEGQSITETWSIQTTSGDHYSMNVLITGTNDEPVITFTDSPATEPTPGVTVQVGDVTDEVSPQASGVLDVDDPDNGDTHTWSLDPTTPESGTYGTLTLDADSGEWVYVLADNAAVNDLAHGETATETFIVTVTDSELATDTRTITLQVTGVGEDVLVVDSVIETLTMTEDVDDRDGSDDGIHTASGSLAAPTDLGDNPTWTLVDGSGQYGNISVDASGNWDYTLNNSSHAVQSLQIGETAQDTFTLYVVDEHGKTVVDGSGQPQLLEFTVNVQGSNDAPNITGDLAESINADKTSPLSGTLQPGDVDTNDSHNWSIESVPQYGAFSLMWMWNGASGEWSYDLDTTRNDLIELNGRDSAPVTETITVKVVDSLGLESEKDIVITINGVNDAPTISGDANAALSEDGVLTQTKQLIGDDVDIGDTVTFDAKSLNGTYGLFIIDAAGEWSYTIYNDEPHLQALAKDEVVTESFTVFATDDLGTEVSQVVTISVTGSNDVPVLSGDVQGIVQEASGSSASGKLVVSDADVGDSATFSIVSNGSLGALQVNALGEWTYVVDDTAPAVNALSVGESTTDTIQVKAVDSENGESNIIDITITINGTNDAPDIVAIATQEVTEDTLLTLSGTFDSGDPDISDPHSWSVLSSDARGTLTVNQTTGAWDFELNNTHADIQSLAAGETLMLSYTIQVIDELDETDTQVVEFEVTGTNGAPNVVTSSSTLTETINADSAITSASGSIVIDDEDTSDTHTFALTGDVQVLTSSFGEITIDRTTGAWNYTLNVAAGLLLKDELVGDTFTVTIDDDNGGVITQVLTVNIQGTDDTPVITGSATGQVQEDYLNQTSGQLAATDTETDTGDLTWQLVSNSIGQYGTLSFNPTTGEWDYQLTPGSTNDLVASATDTDEFIVDVSDGVKTTQHVIAITVIGNVAQQGSVGYDLLQASSADEWLWGGPNDGSDVGQSDSFAWSDSTVGTSVQPGIDYVKDFDAGEDIIDLSDFVNANDVWQSVAVAQQVNIDEVGSDTQISLFDSNQDLVQTIILQDVLVSELTSEDTSSMTQAELLSTLVSDQAITISQTYGHEGDDTLTGSANDDILLGGLGEDTFVMLSDNAGTALNLTQDTLADFSVSDDIIDLSDLLPDAPSMSELFAHIDATVVDDINDPNDDAYTLLEVTDENGGQSNIKINDMGYSELGLGAGSIDDAIVTALVEQLRTLQVET